MNILLLSMSDSFEHMPPVVVRMPNGALASLAGNVDPHHRVAIADLILVQTLDVPRFERLCRAIIDAGLDDVDYVVQAMTAPLAQHGATSTGLTFSIRRRIRKPP